MTMFLAFGITFEIPLAQIVLVRAGVVTPEKLKGGALMRDRRRLRHRGRRDAARTCSRNCCWRYRCACSTSWGSIATRYVGKPAAERRSEGHAGRSRATRTTC